MCGQVDGYAEGSGRSDLIERGNGTVSGRAVEVAVRRLHGRHARESAVGGVREVIENGLRTCRRDLENRTCAVGPALIGGSIEVAVKAQAEPALRVISVSTIEVEQVVECTRGSDLEDVSRASASRSGSSVDISILALRKQPDLKFEHRWVPTCSAVVALIGGWWLVTRIVTP